MEARDLVELLVTKNMDLLAARSFWRVSGIPSIRESPWVFCGWIMGWLVGIVQ